MKQVKEKPGLFDSIEKLFIHDVYTYQHSFRVADLLYKFGLYLNLDDTLLNELFELGTLHDIGKLEIPFDVLNKICPLTKYERQLFFKHTIYGYELLKELNYSKTFLDGLLYHHENFDGTGYPYGIKGMDIPLQARMLRIVDSYDAMTNERSYQKAYTHKRALNEILYLRCKHYDPMLVDPFIKMMKNK
ncbi:HD domain-containing phosphohydrolase (plasmid) [Metabacillus halosaccharovorans]|uniref:HD-GYP domain-containing protein n=1 Tax=Metabacillus halosaccharovorans TaxID=930124 RepID=UPI00203F1682|nr:HD domain-containing phosphohydrolase [Metabacillus halosaccharovorans]MCM3441371.1 HD domain-containing protein [Metabacillus halosaccharovorans]